ncbi:MAG: hypothetical protein Q6365_021345 [Candidatus Sigynarchaeota archaeon]
MLSSKDPKIFFSGLKILVAILESNDEPGKRAIAEKLLSMLCKIMPSYVKRGTENYALNKTKIEESIKSGKHPLDLKTTLALAKRGSIPAQATDEKPTGFVMTAIPPSTSIERTRPVKVPESSEDDIKVISVEDIVTGEEELVAMAKQDAAQEPARESVEGQESTVPSTSEDHGQEPAVAQGLDFQQPEEETYEDDEWVSADSLKDVIDDKILYDKEGKISTDLKVGLNLINPVEREKEIDLNYSSMKGYHDLYSTRITPAGPSPVPPPEAFVEPKMELLGEPDEPASRGVDLVDSTSMAGQPCGLGDGEISASDSKVYVCPNCKAIFHEGCGKVILEVEGGCCPTCNMLWR